MDKESKIYITGAGGMVGKTLISRLRNEGYQNIITKPSSELDLRNSLDVENFFASQKPEYVIHLAAKVGGIAANIEQPVEFLLDNIKINANVISSAHKNKVKKLLNLGSSCIYPRECPQPMKEESLLTGKLEQTNEGYAIAKISALKLCEYYHKQYGDNFISLMPPNLYSVNDHFNQTNSHVLSALISRFLNAKNKNEKEVVVWGTGNVRREFLYDEDLVDAILYFMQNYDANELQPFVNVGNGKDISIKELAYLIKDLVAYEGKIVFDTTKPEGMPKKLLDSSKANNFGWFAKTSIEEGLKKTIKNYLEDKGNLPN